MRIILLFCVFTFVSSATIDEILKQNDSLKNDSENLQIPLSPEKVYQLAKFRETVSSLLKNDYERSDAYLLGWLLSTKWSIFSAKQMLTRAIRWKQQNFVEELGQSDVPSDMLERFYYRVDGRDKDGCPVLETNLATWDVTSFIFGAEFPRDAVEKMNRYIWQMFEKAELEVARNSQRCSQYTFVADLEGFSLRTISDIHSMSVIMGNIKAFQNYYPGAMKIAYFINAPQDIREPLKLFKPLVSGLLVSKVNIYHGPEEWKPILSSKIDLTQLNAVYDN